MHRSPIGTSKAAFAVTAAAIALVTGLATATNSSADPSPTKAVQANPQTTWSAGTQHGDKADYDTRIGSSAAGQAAITRRAALASSRSDTRALGATLGAQALVDLDGTTMTVRNLARLDGYLTDASAHSARTVALNYVRAHLSALGLTSADLSTFRLTRDYRDIAGTHHLSWTQSVGGVDVFGNGLQAAVTSTGRLLSLGGSPVSGLRAVQVETPRSPPPAATSASRPRRARAM
jgi:extracellular elastinolytic metalloproteinase